MSYVTKHVRDPHERLIYATRLHWIYLVKGVVWLVLSLAVAVMVDRGMPADIRHQPPMILYGWNLGAPYLWGVCPWGGIGALLCLTYVLKYFSTELVITNLRVIYKTGLVHIEVQEIELDDIEAERIDHGWLGSLLGYGFISLDCRFVGDLSLPSFKNPYKFLRAMHYARQKVLNAPRPHPTVK